MTTQRQRQRQTEQRGGYGTHDEGFEALTLVQTGKSPVMPIVCIDAPGGSYWKDWQAWIDAEKSA